MTLTPARTAAPAADDLQRGFDGVVTWLRAMLPRFDPRLSETTERPHFSRLKSFVELALFCMLCRRRLGDAMPPAVLELGRFMRDVVSRPRFFEQARDVRKFLPYMLAYTAVEQCGFSHPGQRELLQRLLDRGYATALEMAPFRVMDLRYTLDNGGFRHRLAALPVLYRRTTLARRAPLTNICTGDMYSVTHTIFYLADYGFRPIHGLGVREHARCERTVTALLGMAVMAGNWDLTGELLLSCRCLRHRPIVIHALSWRALLAAQRSDGSFPGPGWDPAVASALTGDARRDYDFEENYHTTLVGGLACLLEPLPDASERRSRPV